jgi:phosphonate metabolism-associated iron-containing alcohol dehydrogenase
MVAQPIHLNWFNPVHITFGADCFSQIGEQFGNAQPVVVLADRAAMSLTAETALVDALGAQCKAWAWFQGRLATVAQARELCEQLWPTMQQHPDAIVLAIGGGTTLDLAKVIRYRVALQGAQPTAATIAHWRTNTLSDRFHRHPLWLVPTTSGTGSEVTRWATVWDTDAPVHAKLSWAPADGFAERAFVDPQLTLSCPERITRDCALDTLAHALESIWNHHANAATAALAVQAARLVISALPFALKMPDNLAARTDLSRASLMAGLAMSQTQTALAHALSYDLTLREGLPHGEACAVWLPMAWELALGTSTRCDETLGQVFELPAASGVHALKNWLERLGVSTRELRGDSAGLATLKAEMQSARGRNFIARQH